jgi:hypothetical protein
VNTAVIVDMPSWVDTLVAWSTAVGLVLAVAVLGTLAILAALFGILTLVGKVRGK